MKRLNDVLPAENRESANPTVRRTPAPGECLRDERHGTHECHACCDGGFVLSTSNAVDPRDRLLVPCPDCKGPINPGGMDDEATFLRRARIPARYAGCTITNWLPTEERQPVAVRRYVSTWQPPRPFLLLTGNRGTGKTHLANGALRDVWQRQGKVGVFWNVQDLLERYKAAFDEDRATETPDEINRALDRSPLLVLDDFGAHRSTEWADSLLYRLIDYRYANGCPLIITTNAPLLQLPARVLSRLKDAEVSITVQFDGPDNRLTRRHVV